MITRWILIPLTAVAVTGCADSTAPEIRSVSSQPLSLPAYALQLRGDPFLRSVAEMLGRPRLSDDIDAAVTALTQTTSLNNVGATTWLNSARFDLTSAANETADQVVTESDVLTAALMVTLDRVAELSADGGSGSQAQPDSAGTDGKQEEERK